MKHEKARDKVADRIAVALYRDAVGEDLFEGDEGEELQVLRRIAAAAPSLLAENERLRAALSNLALEATHFLDNGIGRIHLRESIEHANFYLSAQDSKG